MSGWGGAGLFAELAEQTAPAPRGRGRRGCAPPAGGGVSLDELVPADHRVRLVWNFVQGLDLSALYPGIEAVEGRPGHAPADPRILVALWLYATVEGIGSARRLARPCEEHLAFQWLCGGVSMNHKRLADFRVAHGAVLERLLVDSFTGLLKAGVASLDRVAQDGVRVRASAGAASFRRRSTLQKCHRQAADEVRCLRAAVDADPGAASRRGAAQRAAEDRDRRVKEALPRTCAPSRRKRRANKPSAPQREARRGLTRSAKNSPGTSPRRNRGPRPPMPRRG